MFTQSGFQVRFEWAEEAIDICSAGIEVVIVVDVFSFCTSVDIAVAKGAEVLPFTWGQGDAAGFAAECCAILAGRSGEMDKYTLRPSSLLEIPAGTRLVLPSPNGSALSFRAAALGKTVVAACLRNASAVGKWAKSKNGVLVVAAGERWPNGMLRPCYEDLIGAGAVIDALGLPCSPEAEAARAAFCAGKEDLCERLLACGSGRELVEREFTTDIELAAALNSSDAVPILKDGAFGGDK